jgi:hypothetical protein
VEAYLVHGQPFIEDIVSSRPTAKIRVRITPIDVKDKLDMRVVGSCFSRCYFVRDVLSVLILCAVSAFLLLALPSHPACVCVRECV